MNFEHTEDRRMLADSLNRFVSEQYAIEARNHVAYGEEGHSPLLYGQFADIGAIGALFPEDAGGFGGQGFDISVVFECLGRGLVAEPLLGALVVGQALIAAGSDAQKDSWQPSSAARPSRPWPMTSPAATTSSTTSPPRPCAAATAGC